MWCCTFPHRFTVYNIFLLAVISVTRLGVAWIFRWPIFMLKKLKCLVTGCTFIKHSMLMLLSGQLLEIIGLLFIPTSGHTGSHCTFSIYIRKQLFWDIISINIWNLFFSTNIMFLIVFHQYQPFSRIVETSTLLAYFGKWACDQIGWIFGLWVTF